MSLRRLTRLGLAILVVAVTGCATKVEVAQGRWLATCSDVSVADCHDIAELFVNNLAWSEEAIRWEANGVMLVTAMDSCPELPDWAIPGDCWRASAPTRTERACMVVARQKIGAAAPFGRAGGDNYTGLLGAPKPGTTPC